MPDRGLPDVAAAHRLVPVRATARLAVIALLLELAQVQLLLPMLLFFGIIGWPFIQPGLALALLLTYVLSSTALVLAGIELMRRQLKLWPVIALALITVLLMLSVLALTLAVPACGTRPGCRTAVILQLLAVGTWIATLIVVLAGARLARPQGALAALLGLALSPVLPGLVTTIVVWLLTDSF
jgi:hypothetical protein